LGPGGIGDYGLYKDCTGGAHLYLDRLILTYGHIFQTPTCRALYQTGPFEPEGILGNLTSIFLCFLGLQAGKIIVFYKDDKSRILRWVIWGVVFGLIALGLCGASKNDGIIPINKNLWSVSFIFSMASTAFLLFSVIYFIVDVKKIWNGAPFIFVGRNPIIIYCAHELLGGRFPFGYLTENTHASILACNIISVACWLLVAYRMYQLDFFVVI